MSTRQGCLRSEAASLYPGIVPGVWVRAALLQRQAWRHEAARAASGAAGRRSGLRDEHFAFRDEPEPAPGIAAAPVSRQGPRITGRGRA